MSDFMSDFIPVPMNVNERASAEQTQQRVDAAVECLRAGLKSSTVVQQLSTKYRVSPRQARRYVSAARCEMWDAPDTYVELSAVLYESVDHLSLMADEAKAGGDTKTSIQAAKALAQIAGKRMDALQRLEMQREALSKRYAS